MSAGAFGAACVGVTFVVLSVIALATLESPTDPVQLDPWTTDPAYFDGRFRPCTSPDQVQLVCAVAYGDAP